MRVLFFGTPAFAVPSFDALLASAHEVVGAVTQPDRPRGRGQHVTPPPVKVRAVEHGVPVVQPDKLTADPWQALLAAFDAEIGVVAAYGRILPDWLLALPPRGLVNVHASLLPRSRGASPIHRAVMHGDAETGVTIMRVVKALDAGAMLSTGRVSIGPDDTTDVVERALATLGARLLVETLDRLASGQPVEELAQVDADATYAPRLRKEEGLVDWARPAAAIHNQIRGLHPWPHAHTYGPRGRIILHRSRVADLASGPAPLAPGTIIDLGAEPALMIATGSGVLELLEVQAEGGKVLPARVFATGHPLAPGTRLGAP